MTVLIVEDEKSLSHEIEIFLTKQSYNCDVAFNAKSAVEKATGNGYDFILLDIGLPDGNGFDVLNQVKSNGVESSIIILTARGEVDDKIHGLQSGADDYLAKPFSLPELFARMQAITRRKHGLKNTIIKIHDFDMDVNNRTVACQNNLINLTKKEFDLLYYMTLNKNRVLTRLQLTEHIWGDVIDDDNESNYIDVHIKNLRKKLATQGNADFIETVRGLGYRVNMQ
jgi:DNA-binding response OmpR family regulator